jgi:hypothetical protein
MNASRTSAGLLAVLLAGCTAPAGQGPVTGEVAGRLVREGGPPDQGSQPGQRPMPGTVTFTSAAHRRLTVRVGNSGTFTVRLPPGRYRVSGPCSRPSPVTVTARHTAHVKIICIVRVGSPPSA